MKFTLRKKIILSAILPLLLLNNTNLYYILIILHNQIITCEYKFTNVYLKYNKYLVV